MKSDVAVHNSIIKTPLDWTRSELAVFLHALQFVRDGEQVDGGFEVRFERSSFKIWGASAYRLLLSGLDGLARKRFYRERSEEKGLAVFNLISHARALKHEREVSIVFTPHGADVVHGLREAGDFTLVDLESIARLKNRNSMIFYLNFLRLSRLSKSTTFFVGFDELRSYLGFVPDKKIGIVREKFARAKSFKHDVLKKISGDFREALGVELDYSHDEKRGQLHFSVSGGEKKSSTSRKPKRTRPGARAGGLKLCEDFDLLLEHEKSAEVERALHDFVDVASVELAERIGVSVGAIELKLKHKWIPTILVDWRKHQLDKIDLKKYAENYLSRKPEADKKQPERLTGDALREKWREMALRISESIAKENSENSESEIFC